MDFIAPGSQWPFYTFFTIGFVLLFWLGFVVFRAVGVAFKNKRPGKISR